MTSSEDAPAVRLEDVVLSSNGTDGWSATLVVDGVPVCTLEGTGTARPRVLEWRGGGDPQDLSALTQAVSAGAWRGISSVGGLLGPMALDGRGGPDPGDRGHAAPLASVQDASVQLRPVPTPLLEEERDAGL